MSISAPGALSSSKVRKLPSREEPSGRCLTICQWPRAELGRQEFLGEHEVGLLEQLVGDAAELLRRAASPLVSRVMARGRMRSIESQRYDQ
jgi:hypothetical protein